MHAKAVVVLEEAAEDLAAGIAFYDAQESGVGQYLVESLVADIAALELHAGTHAEQRGFHRMLASRFPFAVYYDIVDGVARVAAVLDMRRDPTWLRQELEGRGV